MQALTVGNPEQFLAQASTITEIDESSTDMFSMLSNQENQDQRARQTADQQLAAVSALQAQLNAKKQIINAAIDQVNSAAMKQGIATPHHCHHSDPIGPCARPSRHPADARCRCHPKGGPQGRARSA